MALLFAVSAGIKAQSVTYNHDESVQNQVTIQETGAGLHEDLPVTRRGLYHPEAGHLHPQEFRCERLYERQCILLVTGLFPLFQWQEIHGC